jgi:ribonuclease HI
MALASNESLKDDCRRHDARAKAPMNSKVVIYTDGACRGNPGPGGWGAILISGQHERELWGGELSTTNNRMELKAAIEALRALKRPCKVELHTDSQYLRTGISEWLAGWKAKGWRTAAKTPVKNEDLWRALDEARLRHEVDWRWVKGHSGHELNERADELARKGMLELLGE